MLLSGLTNLTALEVKRGPSSIARTEALTMQLPSLNRLSSLVKLQVGAPSWPKGCKFLEEFCGGSAA